MYMEKFGDLMIQEVRTPQSGDTLCAMWKSWTGNPMRIFMDVNIELIPDGQTAYFVANKIIVTVHWSNITQEDMSNLFNNTLKLRAGLLEEGLFMITKFGDYKWGDVNICPGLMTTFNNPQKAVDEIIFVFVESTTSKVVGARSFPVNGEFAMFLTYGDDVAMKHFQKNGPHKDSYKSIRDLHSDWASLTMGSFMQVRMADLDALSTASGVYGLDADASDFARFYKF